jgi:hypothetical protein
MLYEGTSEIHELIQAGYALGTLRDTPLRLELPSYPFDNDPPLVAKRSGVGSL